MTVLDLDPVYVNISSQVTLFSHSETVLHQLTTQTIKNLKANK